MIYGFGLERSATALILLARDSLITKGQSDEYPNNFLKGEVSIRGRRAISNGQYPNGNGVISNDEQYPMSRVFPMG